MIPRPETKYAWNQGFALAYQVFGEGSIDLVYLQGWVSHVDLNWESPHLARFLIGLGAMARVIHTDRRGWGCSDRFCPGHVSPMEALAGDLAAVMDAAASERAVICASYDTAPAAILFAATHPDRTAGLVLIWPKVAFYRDDESREHWAQVNDRVRREWGATYLTESGWDEREHRDWAVPWSRASVAPGALATESDAFGPVDIRPLLPAIHVSTLVVGDPDDDEATQEDHRTVAAGIPGARSIWPKGNDVGPFHWYGPAPAILEAVGELIAGIEEG